MTTHTPDTGQRQPSELGGCDAVVPTGLLNALLLLGTCTRYREVALVLRSGLSPTRLQFQIAQTLADALPRHLEGVPTASVHAAVAAFDLPRRHRWWRVLDDARGAHGGTDGDVVIAMSLVALRDIGTTAQRVSFFTATLGWEHEHFLESEDRRG